MTAKHVAWFRFNEGVSDKRIVVAAIGWFVYTRRTN